MKTKETFFNEVLNNYINGNIKDYKKQLKSMNKITLYHFSKWLWINDVKCEIEVNDKDQFILINKN